MTVIEEYISISPEEHRPRLLTIYHLLKEELPGAKEKMSYQMPTFWQGENIVHFALFKNHIGLYPTTGPIIKFEKKLHPYKHSKGAIQFQHNQELPIDIIKEIVKYRITEVLQQ